MTLGTMNTPSDTGYDGKDTRQHPARGRAVQPPDEPGRRAEGRSLRLRRLRQLPRAPFSPTGDAEALVGRAGQGPRPVPPAARHRRRRRRARLRVRPRERPHPDLQPRRRVPQPSGPTRSGRPTSCSTRQGRAYVSELWWHKGQTSRRHGPTARPAHGRVSVYDGDGKRARALGQRRRRPRPAASPRRTASRWTRAATST